MKVDKELWVSWKSAYKKLKNALSDHLEISYYFDEDNRLTIEIYPLNYIGDLIMDIQFNGAISWKIRQYQFWNRQLFINVKELNELEDTVRMVSYAFRKDYYKLCEHLLDIIISDEDEEEKI